MFDRELKTLMAALKTAPRKIIHGIVHPSGVAASNFRGDTHWNLTFSFAAWAFPDGPIQRTQMRVRREVDESEIPSYREQLLEYSIVAVEVGLPEEPQSSTPQAWLHKVIPSTPDRPDLVQAAKDLQKPAVEEDQQFGQFTLDRRVGWYEAQTSWDTDPVRLALDSDRNDGTFPHDCLRHAKELWRSRERWDKQIRDRMIKDLLPLKNDSWLDEDEPRLSEGEFLQRISPESVTIRPDGGFEFWFADGDLFGGHSIMVSGSLNTGIERAGIHG